VAHPRAVAWQDNRGVALVITLLLLFLMSVLGLAAVLSTGSDLLINGYYSSYRASFYAADSGMNIARQAITTQLVNAVPATWNASWASSTCSGTTNSYPLSSTNGTGAMTYVTTTYGTSYTLTGSSAPDPAPVQGSLSESFVVLTTGPYPSSVSAPTVTPTCSTGSPSVPIAFKVSFPYTLTVVGSATGSEQATITENGSIVINVAAALGTTPTNVSFAAFGAFIDSFPPCVGPLVYGTTTGPLYADSTTNCPNGVSHCGSWNFGSGGSYTFTDPVNQTGADFSYISGGGGCTQSSSTSYKSGGTTIAPNFEAGANLNQTVVNPPANEFSQVWAVLDGKGCGEGSNVCGNLTSPTPPNPLCMTGSGPTCTLAAQMAGLQNSAQQTYGSTFVPGTSPASGVYLPYSCSGTTCTMDTGPGSTAGGIYVEGQGSGVTTNVNLSTANGSGGGATAQVITVTQTGGASAPVPGPVTAVAGTYSCTSSGGGGHGFGHGFGGGGTTYTCTENFTQTTTQATNSTVTTITVDPVAGTTTMQSYVQTVTATTVATTTASCGPSSTDNCAITTPGSISGGTTTVGNPVNGPTTTQVIQGVPQNTNSNAPDFPGTSTPAATMVYVDGSVNVGGPASGSGAAVQNNSMVTLTANGNIQQTSNLLYATEPVTTQANQVISGSNPACCNPDPVDTLIPSNENMNQVLGLYTINGQFQLNPANSGDSLETDASIAAIGPSGMIATPGNSVGTWTVVGGRSESSINGVNISTGNTYFDRRFTARGNFAPPWFPQTSIAMGDITAIGATQTTYKPSRIQWVSLSGGQ
jgi:Tfp pilus assembly protein PilX